MSYDLYFTGTQITRDDFKTYFAQRGRYEVSDQQAIYQNEDTGVYFIFDYTGDGSGEDEQSAAAAFNLNFLRPHFFGLEAAPELEAFVKRFGFSVEDPQDGMPDGAFSREGFLDGWNRGNEFGYAAMLRQQQLEKVWSYPTQRLEAIWRWNFENENVQQSFGEEMFVPRIMFVEINNAPASVAVWPDAISELIPEVDYLVIGRDELAPRSLFGRRNKDQMFVPIEQVQALLAEYRIEDYSLPAFRLPTAVPEAVRDFVRTLQPTGIDGNGIQFDRILNAEIVDKALRQ